MKKKLKTIEQIEEEFKDIIYYNIGNIYFKVKGGRIFITPAMEKYFGTIIDVEPSTIKGKYNYL